MLETQFMVKKHHSSSFLYVFWYLNNFCRYLVRGFIKIRLIFQLLLLLIDKNMTL